MVVFEDKEFCKTKCPKKQKSFIYNSNLIAYF
jgi:hypothetical protein